MTRRHDRRPEKADHPWPLAGLLLCALVIKGVVLTQLADHPLLQPQGELDTATYVDLARQIADGGPLAVRQAFALSPLYVFFLAGIFAVGGSLFTAKVVQIVLGTAAIALLFATTRRWFGTPSAYVAAMLATLTGLFTFYEVLILQAALDAFLTAAALYLVTRAVTETGAGVGAGWLVAAGIVVGCLALNRPNALAYGAFVAAWLLMRGRGPLRERRAALPVDRTRTWGTALARAALFAGGIALVIAPNALRNYLVSGDAILVSSHGGLNFYIGNNATATGTYQRLPDITPSMVGQIRDATVVAERATGRSLSPGEVSSYFVGEAVRWMAGHPLDAIRLTARKVMLVLNAESVPLNYSYAYFSRDESTLLRVLVIGPWLVIPLGVAGLVRASLGGPRDGFWAWAGFIPIYAASVVAFFVSSRYRMPWLMPLCATAGAAVVGLTHAVTRREWSREPWTIAAAAVLAVACFWPMGIDDRRTGERARMAVWLAGHGNEAEAMRVADEAAGGHPNPASLRARMGDALAGAQRFEPAIDQYRRSLAIDDRQPAVHFSLGQTLVVAKRPGEAVVHLSRAVEAGYRPATSAVWLVRALALAGDSERAVQAVRAVPDEVLSGAADEAFDLGSMALELGDPVQAARALRLAVAADARRAEAHEQLGVALLMLNRASEAVSALERACTLQPSSASAHLNLAVAYATAGRPADARRSAEKSLQLDPQEPRTAALLRSLPS